MHPIVIDLKTLQICIINMKFNASQISDIIQMAWDDQTDFSHITKIYDIDEGEVKKIMKKNIKNKSYKIWRERISKRSAQKSQLKGIANA
ncbi:MAG: TIGR03643 family protein [Pelagibacteraceae bacterium]|nr:TIGR03643 family protein [Pelagibacteraceae bacterium]